MRSRFLRLGPPEKDAIVLHTILAVRVFPRRHDPEDWWREGPEVGEPRARVDGRGVTEVTGCFADPLADWLNPNANDEEGHAQRDDVALAMMLMLGADPWQRIDGMGMARKALQSADTADHAREFSYDERLMLANARAWCLAVHGDLSPVGLRDDPMVVADANRYVEFALAMAPQDPEVATTLALVRLRQGRIDEAVRIAQDAVQAFGSLPDRRRTGRAHGTAVLAVVTLALAKATVGDHLSAKHLVSAARAVRTALDIDEVALSSLTSEISALSNQSVPSCESPPAPDSESNLHTQPAPGATPSVVARPSELASGPPHLPPLVYRPDRFVLCRQQSSAVNR